MEQNDNEVEALANAYGQLDMEEEVEVLVVAPMAQPSTKHNLTMMGIITSEKSGMQKIIAQVNNGATKSLGKNLLVLGLEPQKGQNRGKKINDLFQWKGIRSDNKPTSGNKEDNRRPSIGEGGLLSHERGHIELKRRRVEDSAEYQNEEDMEIAQNEGKNGEEASYKSVAHQAQQ